MKVVDHILDLLDQTFVPAFIADKDGVIVEGNLHFKDAQRSGRFWSGDCIPGCNADLPIGRQWQEGASSQERFTIEISNSGRLVQWTLHIAPYLGTGATNYKYWLVLPR